MGHINNKFQAYEASSTEEKIANEKFFVDFFRDFYAYLGKLCGIKYIWEVEIKNDGQKEITNLELSLPLIKGFYEIWGIEEGEDSRYKKIENGIIKIKSIKPRMNKMLVLWTYPSEDPARDYYFEEETKLSHSDGSVDITYIGEKPSFGIIKSIKDSLDSCPAD